MPTPKQSSQRKRSSSIKTPAPRISERNPPSAFDQAIGELRHSPAAFPNISPRWLAAAAAVAVFAALACAWLTLCLLYWQGSWQLFYHPKAAIVRTPASIGIPYEPIRFAVTETGQSQLTGWWIPAPTAKFTVLFLHGAGGNLSDTVETVAALRRLHLSIFAIDYRGYGQSLPAKPSEKQLRQDAEWALSWLTVTRKIPAQHILVFGTGLGANLAAELAAQPTIAPATEHGALAGVILDQPLQDAMAPVFDDPRSRLVPAHWLVRDRYDLTAAASNLKIPSLWLFPESGNPVPQTAFRAASAQKSSVWLKPPIASDPNFPETLRRWLDDLP